MFFHPLTFSLYVSLGLKQVSCRQHIYLYRSCFSTHSARLCLFVGAFNPFTFKVIIVIYVPIAIFLMVWGWFADLFSSVVFLDYIKVPLTFFVKLVWWYWILLTYACLKSFLFLHQFWMRSLLGTVILVVGFSFTVPWKYSALPFWPAEFLLKDQLLSIWGFPCMLLVAFPLLLLTFFLCV